MRIDAVDFYYLSIPEVRDVGDGSQDALLVRVRAGQHIGWGECEAAPLACLASWNCPISHSACKPISASILGQKLETPADIYRLNALVRANSFDLLQTDHTLSGIDTALWDLLGRRHESPIWKLLGYRRAWPKLAYASQLFGDTPAETFEAAQSVPAAGFKAAKFGWGPYGRGDVKIDAEHIRAAREGLGSDCTLLVDAGTVWGTNVPLAARRLKALHEAKAEWLEEPFVNGALAAYHGLSRKTPRIKLAGGEGCHDFQQARNMIDHAGLAYIQIDSGRIGGITTAFEVAQYAKKRGVTFVNHTFTTHLALSASIQPYAGLREHRICEYPLNPSELARDFTRTKILPDKNGEVQLPPGPGLGLVPDTIALKKYLVPTEIHVRGQVIFKTPDDFA